MRSIHGTVHLSTRDKIYVGNPRYNGGDWQVIVTIKPGNKRFYYQFDSKREAFDFVQPDNIIMRLAQHS